MFYLFLYVYWYYGFFFFFQAEDGIRDFHVTGVQTCALPIFDLFPYEVRYGSNKTIWWKCPNGPDHEWTAPPHNRIAQNQGCPFCSGRRASVTNSLATMRPHLAKEWHSTRNTLTPRDVTPGSAVKVWWKCEAGPDHEWLAAPNTRTNIGAGCPCCDGKQ